MTQLKNLIHEIHRRSVWQVIGIYLLGGWIALQVVETLVDSLGLPDWFPAFAVMLLIVGFPIVVATAFVQEGVGPQRGEAASSAPTDPGASDHVSAETSSSSAPSNDGETANLSTGTGSLDRPSTRPPKLQRMLTWRNAIMGGVVAFAMWGVIAALWMGLNAWVDSELGPEAGPVAAAVTPDAGEALKAVAVLPFENLSTDQENAFFADGIHEDVLTQLSKIRDLTVISRTSVMMYRDDPKPLAEVGRELGVGAIVEGSVRRSGDNVRITAQLIDAETDRHLWADNYDRALTAANVFAIQTEIAQRIASALAATLSPAEESRIARRPTDNLEAYEAALRGREAYRFYTDGGNTEAIRLFRQAIEQDPSYAEPWAGLADAFGQRVLRYGYGIEWADSAEVAAQRALELNPELATAHKALGLSRHARNDQTGSVEANIVAIELDPNYADPLMNKGVIEWALGRPNDAVRSIERGFRLQPNVAFARANLAYAYAVLGEFDRAHAIIASAMQINPNDMDAMTAALTTTLYQGDTSGALQWAERLLAVTPDEPYALAFIADAYSFAGDHDRTIEVVERSLELSPEQGQLGTRHIRAIGGYSLMETGHADRGRAMLQEVLEYHLEAWDRGTPNGTTVWHVATAYAALGDYEEALRWLGEHRDLALSWTFFVHRDPVWDGVREDPRFEEIMSDMLAKVEQMRVEVMATDIAEGRR